MSLDLSGPKQLAQDFFRLSHDYQTHDPDLAAEICRKAYTICNEFGLDVASMQSSDSLGKGSVDHLYVSQSGNGQTIERLDEEHDQLHGIMNSQRAIVDAQAAGCERPSNTQESVNRSNRSMLSWWLHRQQAV